MGNGSAEKGRRTTEEGKEMSSLFRTWKPMAGANLGCMPLWGVRSMMMGVFWEYDKNGVTNHN